MFYVCTFYRFKISVCIKLLSHFLILDLFWKSKFLKHRILVLCHFLFLVSGFHNNSFAQEINCSASLSQKLIENGFENVKLKMDESDLMIAFENRVYRSQARGLAEVLKIISKSSCVGANSEVQLILLYQEVPMILIALKLSDYQDFINDTSKNDVFENDVLITFNFKSTWGKITSVNSQNQSKLKSEILIIPELRAQLGKFTQPVESNINIIPEYNLLISKGFSFKSQMIIPIYNELDKEGDKIRPGLIAINKFMRLEDDVFFDATAGFFNKNRAGANIEMKKYFANGKLSVGANVGFTTDYSFTGNTTEYLVDQNFLTALLISEYRYEPYDLIGRIQAGNFLYNELGVRTDLWRQFGEVSIGFFAIATKSDFNGGFNFSIPIPPSKYSKPGFVRVRPAEKFSWEYRAIGLETSGTIYNTENELFILMSDFNPDYVKRNFLIEIKK